MSLFPKKVECHFKSQLYVKTVCAQC